MVEVKDYFKKISRHSIYPRVPHELLQTHVTQQAVSELSYLSAFY